MAWPDGLRKKGNARIAGHCARDCGSQRNAKSRTPCTLSDILVSTVVGGGSKWLAVLLHLGKHCRLQSSGIWPMSFIKQFKVKAM
jgi:hypothetical protein